MSAAWLVIALLLVLHAGAVRDHLAVVGQRGLRGQAAAPTPYKMAYLPHAVDAQVWVRFARSLLDGHDIQLRHTNIDNTPYGRDVHWNSAWAWTLAGAGRLQQSISGRSLPESLEQATVWLPPAVLLVVIVLLSSYAGRLAGAAAGIALAIGMVGHENFYDGFFPNYADHHGILTASVLGLVLGAIFMGAGWREDASASGALSPGPRGAMRNAAVVSAISGALGVWISAASVIPPIALVGLCGAATVLVTGRAAIRRGYQFDAGVWRLWGRVGAAASLFFYLVEYFPFHLGFRLEVNHPFYAAAWLGGGELIAELSERWLGQTRSTPKRLFRVLGPLALMALAPLTMLIGGRAVFLPFDPFLAKLHREFVVEFMPLSLEGFRWNPYLSVIGIENVPLVAGLALLVARGRRLPPLVWFAIVSTLAFTVMAWVQYRWVDNASGPQMCLALVLVAYLTLERANAARAASAIAVFGVLFAPTAIIRVSSARAEAAAHAVARNEDVLMLYRDIAAALRADQPSGDIRLLTTPNASLSLGYYGDFQTVGTVYWENLAGLKGAAGIFSAQSADQAAALVRERKLTHVVMLSEDDFLAPYYQLLHPNATEDEFRSSFGYQLLVERRVPPWLQTVPYSVPEDLRSTGVDVFVYKVAFDQNPADALYNRALGEVARGEYPQAIRDFDSLIVRDPKKHLAWLGKGGALFAQRDWAAAADAALTGISLAPPAERHGLREWLASNFLRERQPAQAVRVYRSVLADGFDPGTGCSLAFILSTAADDKLRNGAEAVALARRALATRPDSPVYLSCLGAALAETGRYAEAITNAERAIERARAEHDADTEIVAQRVLEAARAGRPLRS